MKLKAMLLGLAALLSFNLAHAGGDIAAGKALSARCAACHGADGMSQNPVWPNLAGQQEGYLAKQLQAFRDGARQDPLMSSQATPLSDQQIADLAAYFSSLK